MHLTYSRQISTDIKLAVGAACKPSKENSLPTAATDQADSMTPCYWVLSSVSGRRYPCHDQTKSCSTAYIPTGIPSDLTVSAKLIPNIGSAAPVVS